MLIDTIVKTRWHHATKEHYIELGYEFTKFNDELYVHSTHLTPSSDVFVVVKCDYCNAEFSQQFKKHIRGREHIAKDACKKCNMQKHKDVMMFKYGVPNASSLEHVRINTGNVHRKYTIEMVREKFSEVGYTLLSTEYKNNSQLLEYICPKHGTKRISFGHFLSGKRCKECQQAMNADKQRFTLSQVKEIIESGKCQWVNQNEYKGYNTRNLKIRCECGDIFITSLSIFARGDKVRCDKCANSQSRYEKEVENYLINNKFSYNKEVSLDGCKYKNRLPFDFITYNKDKSIKCIIEVDGQHHFKPVKFGGISLEEAELNFTETKIRDQIKNQYCKDNNIQLIRIPYWEFDNIDKILTHHLLQ